MKTSNNYTIFITAIISLSIITSCTNKTKPIETYISGYKGLKTATNVELDYPVPGHGNTYRIVYANNISFKPDKKKIEGQGTDVIMHEGSVIVKEVYASKNDVGKKEPELTYMVKIKTFQDQ